MGEVKQRKVEGGEEAMMEAEGVEEHGAWYVED